MGGRKQWERGNDGGEEGKFPEPRILRAPPLGELPRKRLRGLPAVRKRGSPLPPLRGDFPQRGKFGTPALPHSITPDLSLLCHPRFRGNDERNMRNDERERAGSIRSLQPPAGECGIKAPPLGELQRSG